MLSNSKISQACVLALCACGQPGENQELNLAPQNQHGSSQEEGNALGITQSSSSLSSSEVLTQLSEKLEPGNGTGIYWNSFVVFESPVESNRFCRGALGYEVPSWYTLKNNWPNNLTRNYEWNEKKTLDVYLYTDRRCLQDKDKNFYLKKIERKAYVYRAPSAGGTALKLAESKITYDPAFVRTLQKGESTNVVRIWQFRTTNPSSVQDFPLRMLPVCPMENKYGNIKYKDGSPNSRSFTDYSGENPSNVLLYILRPVAGQTDILPAAKADNFYKPKGEAGVASLNQESSNLSRVKMNELGGPVVFEKVGKPSCLYGLLTHSNLSNVEDTIFPSIQELSPKNWYSKDKELPKFGRKSSPDFVNISREEVPLEGDPRIISTSLAEIKVSDNVLGKRDPDHWIEKLSVSLKFSPSTTPSPVPNNCKSGSEDRIAVDGLQQDLQRSWDALHVTAKNNCDQTEKAAFDACDSQTNASSYTIGQCKLVPAVNRVTCYSDANNKPGAGKQQIEALRAQMQPYIAEKGCLPTAGTELYYKGGGTYTDGQPRSGIDLNGPNPLHPQ